MNFLLKVATKRLQQTFKEQYEHSKGQPWQPASVKSFLDSEQDVKKSLNNDQKKIIKRVPEEWDISLLAVVLLNSSIQNDVQVKIHIKALKKIRNTLAHNVSMTITKDEFAKYFDGIEKILLAFGENSAKLSQLKNCGKNNKKLF